MIFLNQFNSNFFLAAHEAETAVLTGAVAMHMGGRRRAVTRRSE
jgi:hypothetical protein